MKRPKILSIFLLLLFLVANPSLAQLSSEQIDQLAQKALKEFNVAGISIAVVKDGKIIHEKGYGVQSVITKLPVDENTNFQIASNSKAFTTAALSILIDEGKLKWSDKVRTYLPEFKMYNDYVTENFTVEDLLCHRSGLGLGAGDLMDFPDGADFTIQDKLTFFQHFKPESNFRTKFDYDNQLYIIAGELVKRVSGISWEEFIQTRILNKLEMNHSYSSLEAAKDKGNFGVPHSVEFGAIKTMPHFRDMVNGAAGGIVSNVHDMSKWLLTQLNKGKYGNNLSEALFTEARQKEMWKLSTVMESYNEPRYNQHFNGYGLGWFINDTRGNLAVSHTGGLPGMLTSVDMIPDLNLGVVVLTNTENSGSYAFRAINRTILDSYLKLEDNNWVEKYSKRYQANKSAGDTETTKVWKTVESNKKIKINSSDYIGIYEDKWFGKMEVFLKDNQLWIKSYRSPKLNGLMQFYKANSFAIKWEYQDMNCDAFALFSLDEEGKAQSIKMKGISPEIDFSFDFQDLDLQRTKRN